MTAKSILAAAGLCLCALLLTAASAPRDFAAMAAKLLADPPTDPDAAYKLKTEVGAEGLIQLRNQINYTVLARAGMAPMTPVSICIFPQPVMKLEADMSMALSSGSKAAWTANWRAADAALARWRATPMREVRTTAEPPGTDARSREYAARILRDQKARSGILALEGRTGWAKDLAGPVWVNVRDQVAWEMCSVDRENTAWIKADLAANGWPRISATSAQADQDAWLLVQHADEDRAFQAQVLTTLEALVPLKETKPSNYAYLYDRVARGQGRAQRYGTQFHGCNAEGVIEMAPVEDPEKLDERRASMGMGPIADAKSRMPTCRKP